ncbi:hypothetical protein DW664_04550 [Lachnospiraceae bacterium AM25-11LB]|jgi:hypothetical protein|uniref:hypothetical protein n=1 Tax=Blautia hansenii TaxID=1322 RepID=UPI000E3EEBEF|nr:hypothetical protein DW675_04560 [Lachnospiraceae bacterium AM25-22]RGD09281.1 hypothetical protein DW664_04550 [Lachnospiraceae bacterium AM25-11LB]RJW13508.1 hypothetical protein DW685_04540 [Lachnospiraceae bacterium AM25-40]RJW18220.1 hypothetical protein DW684_03090 [Lachnospiraceae bacterium AM25-39]
MNKLKIIPFFFLAVLLLLTACSSKQGTGETGEDRFQDEREYLIMANLTESDKGIYGVEWGEEYSPIFFVDKTTGKKTILCQKVNCKHNSEECPAVENGIVGCLAYSNGTLYFLVQKLEKEELELQLYSMKEDGSKKKKLHTFKNVRIFPNQAGLYKGKIVISAQTQKELEDGSGLTTAEPSIVMYDLKTKKETVLLNGAENEGKYTVPCGGSENGIYLVQMPWEDTEQGQECEYLRYDFETGKLSEVYKTTISNMQIIKNDILYLQSEGKQKLEKYNIKTQEKKVVLEWQDDADEIWAREDYIEFRKNTEEGEEKKVYCNWYDFEEEKYLFDEYQDLNKIKVEDKTENGYWIYKEGEPYFYHLEDKSWQKIEEIK